MNSAVTCFTIAQVSKLTSDHFCVTEINGLFDDFSDRYLENKNNNE